MPRTSFRIVIEGTGQHHEGSTLDADYIAQRLATELAGVGHDLASVQFTPGGPNPAQGVYALYESDSLGTDGPQVAEAVDPIVALPPLDEPPEVTDPPDDPPVEPDLLAEG